MRHQASNPGNFANLADAFAKVERQEVPVKTVRGPKALLDKYRTDREVYVPEDDTVWGAKLTDDDGLNGVFVCSE